MIDLEDIAMRRAEQQVSRRGAEIIRNPNWAAAKRAVSRTARELKCDCGECRTCRNRARMRAVRDGHPKRRRGPSMSLGRRCSCGRPIANCNRTKLCKRCRHIAWLAGDRARKDEARRASALEAA